MEKRAKEFLELSAALYDTNKKKWTTSLKKLNLKFDEDVYSDSIIKTYDAILKADIDIEGDVLAYWYKCFITNIKRNKQYSINSKKEDIDVIEYLKDKIDDTPIEQYSVIELLTKIKNNFNVKDYHLFKIYYLTNITLEELSSITGYDVKTKIMKMKKWLKSNV